MTKARHLRLTLLLVGILPWIAAATVAEHLLSAVVIYLFIASNIINWILVMRLHGPTKLPKVLDLIENGLGFLAFLAGVFFILGQTIFTEDDAFRIPGLLLAIAVNPAMQVFGQVIGRSMARAQENEA